MDIHTQSVSFIGPVLYQCPLFTPNDDVLSVVMFPVFLAVKTALPKGIKVTVHIPENMNETSRRQKINRIYDILKPELSR